jgi:hypothetical protein
MRIETSPRITQKGDKDNLGPTSKHPFAFKRGINAAGRERKGHSFQNRLHALAFFLSLKICPQQLHTQLNAPPLNAGEEG